MLSFTEIKNNLVTTLKSVWSKITLNEDSIVYDLLVKAPATEMNRQARLLEYGQLTTTLDGFSQILDDSDYLDSLKDVFNLDTEDDVIAKVSSDLEDFCGSFNFTRLIGNKATVTMTFVFSSNAEVSITTGFQVYATYLNNTYYFNVKKSINAIPLTYNDGTYILKVAVEASQIGTAYNIGSYLINSFSGSLTNLVEVYNELDASGGTDAESNSSFITRVQTGLAGVNLDSISGIKSTLLDGGATAVTLLTSSDSKNVNPDGVDCWVPNVVLASDTISFTWTTSNISGVLATSIYGVCPLDWSGHSPVYTDTTGFLLSGTVDRDYSVVTYTVKKQALGAGASYTNTARDYILFNLNGLSISNGETLSLTYQYNQILTDYQALFESPNEEIFTPVYIKECIAIPCVINVSVKIYSTVDYSTVYNNIILAIKTLFTANNINATIDQSDLIVVIGNISGVDSVTLNTFAYVSSEDTTIKESSLVSSYNSYLTISSSNITLQVTY